jgi:hypothetical protein
VKLTERLPRPRSGQPIRADVMYTAVQPFSGTSTACRMCDPRTPLGRESTAVRAFPQQFVPVDTPRGVVQEPVNRELAS